LSYSVCKHGGKMCDGCMACYDENPCDDDLDYEDEEYEYEEEEEEE
jgi:hypothetical protein